MAVEHLDSLIDLYRKRLGMRKLEYMSVSGVTHLIEVVWPRHLSFSIFRHYRCWKDVYKWPSTIPVLFALLLLF